MSLNSAVLDDSTERKEKEEINNLQETSGEGFNQGILSAK